MPLLVVEPVAGDFLADTNQGVAARMMLEFAPAHGGSIGRGVGEVQVLWGRPPLAPLLEKERHASGQALRAYPARPIGMHRTDGVAWSALAADDHPVNTGEIKRSDIPEQRFQR